MKHPDFDITRSSVAAGTPVGIAPQEEHMTDDATSSDGIPKLTPLTPEFSKSDHTPYVDALTDALVTPQIRNIALSGTYGVGKSSILKELVRRNEGKVLELSLSTLAPFESVANQGALPPQAITPTNRIQQEIVKQLLYREEPRNTPGSRFQRIERFNWSRELLIALIFALIAVVAFLLTGWADQIAKVLPFGTAMGNGIYLVLAPVFMGTALTLRKLFHGRLRIKELSAGAATVTLDDRSVSYFDQYLDEIVYFFEVSKRNIVVFEDIDRFNDAHIFETLRSLNTLLNVSPQIESEIKFIYAIKDSIFDQLGLQQQGRRLESDLLAADDTALAETVRANRTKFFDLVIPVVPFITHQNARDLTTRLLREIEHSIEPKLIDLASRHVPEMRLLKNVRNEFLVFRHQILRPASRLKLSETELFALMLYKSTHLSDFEAIRLGGSKLDLLYNHGRKIVAFNIDRLEKELSATYRRESLATGLQTRSEELGEALLGIGQMLMRAASHHVTDGPFELLGVSYSIATYKGVDFWKSFQDAAMDSVITFSVKNDHYNRTQILSLKKSDIVQLLGERWKPEQWGQLDADAEVARRAQIHSDLVELRAADMVQLLGREDWVAPHSDQSMSLDALAQNELKTGLAYHLVRAGYINRNFNLYTSVFPGDRVSAAAMNFLIYHVQRNTMDEHFHLEPDEADEVIGECAVGDFGEPGIYNVSILDRLLNGGERNPGYPAILSRHMASLTKMGADQRRYLQAILAGSSEKDAVIRLLTPIYDGILIYLCSEVDVEESARLRLIGVALKSMSGRVRYSVDAAFIAHFKANYALIPSLASEELDDRSAKGIGSIFLRCGLSASNLGSLAPALRSDLLARGLYEITRENMVSIMDGGSVALDAIRSMSDFAYDHMIGHLSQYLHSISPSDFSVDVSSNYLEILSEVAESEDADLETIGVLISRASPDCIIEDLDDVASQLWPLVAQAIRFRVSLPNLIAYLDEFESIDAPLATTLLKTPSIADVEEVELEGRQRVAKVILAASDVLAAERRVELATMLGLEGPLPVSELVVESGELFGLALKAKLIEDTKETYLALEGTDWATRAHYIQRSRSFGEFMSPQVIGTDLADFLQSAQVRKKLKSKVVERIDAYASSANVAGIQQLLKGAIEAGLSIPLNAIERYARVPRVSPAVVFELLGPHLATINLERLLAILHSLQGVYSELAASGAGRPLLPDDPFVRPVLARLKDMGILSQFYDDNKKKRKGIRAIKRYA
ncbi:DNA-binding protein [Stenotrophomonas rhizophila]|uniref:YobI family P-loop NTPase n=1 Tax=Stenotrophomonas rhizophila TaxID=216778 RepID=UPI0011A3A570|nr:DNA-binding protein [Stenotrophomonas rhizophila]